MKFLIIGLGSMGKRRIRCLKKLGYDGIIGFDIKEDRRKEAYEEYDIEIIDSFFQGRFDNIDASIISTPPDEHNQYIKASIEKKKPAFVEASLILENLPELDNLAKEKKVLIAPSCTMRFHPAIKEIKYVLSSGRYGKVTNFNYHFGHYLPDWHPWEKVKDFYAGKKKTGGAREMVPFELTWITDIFGFPKNIKGFYGKTMDVGAGIDDTYVISIDFGEFFGSMLIDVVSRYATRNLTLNMEQGQILWRWDENFIKLYDAVDKKWSVSRYQKGEAAEGYHKNIIEDMYVDETDKFIKMIQGKDKFPNSLDADIEVLRLLNSIEQR